MSKLKGTKTHQNLKDAFAGESQANRRYLYFARQADIEGYPDVGGLFRDTAEAETGHAHGHLDQLKSAGDPATDKPIGSTDKNLAAAVAGETYEYTEMYPGMAKTARNEKFEEIAEWFETLARAEKSHAGRFQKALDELEKLERRDAPAGGSTDLFPRRGRPPDAMKVPPPEHASTDLHYDDPAYLDPGSLERELRRVGEICHQCRRCLPLCPSFPKLFELIDATDREIEGVTMRGFDDVNELCYHCKLCYNHCPYTPPHEWDVDFPALMRRQQLARARRDGVPLARRLTTRTDWIGRAGALAPALLNFANRNRPSRVLMEKTLGIHRDWVQPSYTRETVGRWFRRRGPRSDGENGRAVFFSTCSVQYSDPVVGRAAVEVFERSGVRVDVHYERCCGMPHTDTGDLDRVRRHAERNVAELLPFVEAGAVVVVPGPSCSLLMKTEYPRLLGSDAARKVAEATRDLIEHVYDLARAKKLDREFAQPLGKVAYHAPCHLRAQNIGFRARDLLKLAGAEVTLVDACSGVDGTWGMQARFHDESMKVARRMLDRIAEAEPDHISTDCPLSALRIEEGLGRKALHPIVLLRMAYGDFQP